MSIDALLSAENKPHVLVVDDDARLRALLYRYLSEAGFLVTTALDANDARQKCECWVFDLVILDVMMPGESGFELARALRAQEIETPILFLTALQDVQARIEGFEAGGDDYLPKPFEPRELVLRLNAILKRQSSFSLQKDDDIKLGRWAVDLQRGELMDGNSRQPLTQVEHTLLKALVSRKGQVVSREDLARLCDLAAVERTIDVQINRLRKKVELDSKNPKHIQTVRGKGYILWTD